MSDAPEQAREEAQPDGGPQPLLQIEHLKLFFPIHSGALVSRTVAQVHAINDVTFSLAEGQTLGIVGESGCGKTTLSRTIVRLLEPSDGVIRFRGRDITHAGCGNLGPIRKEVQMVFQDPYA